MLFSSIQVVPFVIDTGQAKICFTGIRQRIITIQLQNTLVGLGRQVELVFCFLHSTKTECGQFGDEGMSDRLADGYGFSKSPSGRTTVSFLLVGSTQRPCTYIADRQIIGAQILQSTECLNNGCICLVLR